MNSILDTVNPFTWLWDDIKNFADWHTEGGARRAWERFNEKTKKSLESNEQLIRARQQYDSLVDASKKAKDKMDSTAASTEKMIEDLKNLTPVTGDDQIKELLKDWMNANGWEDITKEADFSYMINMGNNKWSYESEEKNNDGSNKFYYFLFDPTKRTFKEL